MKKFMDEDFLLNSKTAKVLYHQYGAKMPIFDYHNHLITQQIAEDRVFDDISQVWLGGDHYKWRIIRSLGVEEKYITGNASGKEKLMMYAKALSSAVGNPLYHWSHLELKRYFDIDYIIKPENVNKIWDETKEKLKTLSVRRLIDMSSVDTLGTTNDPIEDLRFHKAIIDEGTCSASVRPSFRPDPAINPFKEGFGEYIKELSKAADVEIKDFDSLKTALVNRLDYFVSLGCVATDYGPDVLYFDRGSEKEVSSVIRLGLEGKSISKEKGIKYQTEVMIFLASEYTKRNLVMQIHIGALRNTNTRMTHIVGSDSGFDAAHDTPVAENLSKLLNAIEKGSGLPKTVLFCLNPKDYYSLATVGGCFLSSGGVKGKVQLGTAWWYIDHIEGMEKQLTDYSTLSVLGHFIGMLTDSRSFLSFPRHEYFRRILCNFLGNKVEMGRLPWDEKWLGQIVQDISFNNAKKYFEG